MNPAEFCLVNHLYGDACPTLRFCKFCRKAMCETCYNNHIKAFNDGCSFQAANGDIIAQNPSVSSLCQQNDNVVPQDINMVPVQSSSDFSAPLINGKQLPEPRDDHLYKQCTTHSLTMDQFCYSHCSVICQQCRYETHQDCQVKDVEQVCLELDHTTVGELRKSLNKIRVDAIEVKNILGRNVSDLEKQKQSMMKKLKKAHEDVLKEENRKYEKTKSEIEGQNEKYTSELCAYICHINSILDGLDMCLKDTRPLEGRHMEVGIFLKYQDILSSNSQIPSDLQNLYNKIRKVKVSFKENKRFQPLMEKSAIGNINVTTTKYTSLNPHQEINCPLFVSQPVLVRKDNSVAAVTTTNFTPLNHQQEINCPLFLSQPALTGESKSVAAATTIKYTSLNHHQKIRSPVFFSQPTVIREDDSVTGAITTNYASLNPQQEVSSSLFVSQPVLVRGDKPAAAATSLCTKADRNESGCSVGRETYQYVKAGKDRDLKVRCDDDCRSCCISGLNVTQDGRLLMVDSENDKIKMLTADRQRLLQLQFNGEYLDITVYNNTTAVAAGRLDLLFIDISEGSLAVKKTVRVDFYIYAIQSCGNNLLVSCKDDDDDYVWSVKLITTAGEPLWSVSKDQTGHALFQVPYNLTCYRDQNQCRVVLTDSLKNCITVLDGNTGKVINTITLGTQCPGGVTTDNNGNFYICYQGSDEIVIWNKDMTNSRVLLTTRDDPWALGYDSFRNQLIVSYSYADEVKCYQLQ